MKLVQQYQYICDISITCEPRLLSRFYFTRLSTDSSHYDFLDNIPLVQPKVTDPLTLCPLKYSPDPNILLRDHMAPGLNSLIWMH